MLTVLLQGWICCRHLSLAGKTQNPLAIYTTSNAPIASCRNFANPALCTSNYTAVYHLQVINFANAT